METRVSRRDRRLRLYYLTRVMERMQQVAQPPGEKPIALDWPAMFGVEPATFADWIQERVAVPRWVQQLGEMAYKIPPPRRRKLSRALLVGILLAVVGLGMLAVALL